MNGTQESAILRSEIREIINKLGIGMSVDENL